MRKNNDLVFWGVIVMILVIVIGWAVFSNNQPSKLDGFAQCLGEKGATFYGTFWCPHCQNQKRMFGNAARFLPYVECSPANGQGQLPVCTEKEIKSYPTWRFADGSELTGEVPLSQLAEKTSCVLP